ncbi:hypothetical protein OPV22_007343 [Ensete ventricosum]|uniref:Protein kinase domain-containing protein n=1 Tax=Ensete ventricosum TaxID=4639 RepID=A0AAV8Q6W1_ENSVE|nr:hypothetical protein OPV22_007343 [Ensete ventricosum]
MAMPISSSSVARIATKPFDGLVRSASRSCSIGKIHSDRRTRHPSIRSALITEPDAFEVGKFVGSYGFMNITSYSSFQSGGLSNANVFDEFSPGYSSEDMERLRVQDVGEGQVKISLFQALRGKSNPRSIEGNPSHFQGISWTTSWWCGFETKTGEQWLAFSNDGKYSAADYGKSVSEANSKDTAKGENFWNPFIKEQKINRRRIFVIKLLNGAMNGLAYMHDHDRLHQSLGPSSVVLNTMVEKDVAYLVPKLRDLSFSVDIGYSSLGAAQSTLSEGLWRRASGAGAFTPLEKRAYGIADDIYEAGLFFAYLAFIPFCEAGIMDSISLQRLFENTFQLDLQAVREYCLADDRLLEAVKFLDLGDGAGWELLQAMLNRDYRQRPIAEAVLKHRSKWGSA